MPFRFRKSFKILPGVRLNVSKGGVSTSLGGRGHEVNVGKRGVKTTLGIPGTGISYTSTPLQTHAAKPRKGGCCAAPAASILLITIALLVVLSVKLL